ncbi:MAG: hypothetical protein M1823_007480, partial [Watsoniomyces obsoletus]
MPGEKATGGRSRPRARTNGEDDAPDRPGDSSKPVQQPQQTSVPPSADQGFKKEGTAMGLLRRFSTRRVRDREGDRLQPPTLNVQPPQDSAERFQALGATVIRGEARFVGPRAVAVGDKRIEARRFVIATGSKPAVPAIPGLDAAPYLTNETLFDLTRRPQRLA